MSIYHQKTLWYYFFMVYCRMSLFAPCLTMPHGMLSHISIAELHEMPVVEGASLSKESKLLLNKQKIAGTNG